MQITIALIGVSMAFGFVGLQHQLARIANALEKANQITTQAAKQGGEE